MEKPLGAACLQNETAPKSFNFKTNSGPKNDPKLPRKSLSLVLLCRISHRHYSKIFHREFPHKIKYFFTTRICRHGQAKKRGLFRKVHFLEVLENLEILEILENSQTLENKGESGPFSRDSREFRDFRDSRDFSSEKTPFVMTPFSGPER